MRVRVRLLAVIGAALSVATFGGLTATAALAQPDEGPGECLEQSIRGYGSLEAADAFARDLGMSGAAQLCLGRE